MSLAIDRPKHLAFNYPLRGSQEILTEIRSIVQNDLVPIVEKCDQDGFYPEKILNKLGNAGAFSAHLGLDRNIDFGLAIRAMSEVSKVCGATGFMVWCQNVCGIYIESSKNKLLIDSLLVNHATGVTLGGTGLSNPMKALTGIETMYLFAQKVDNGYLVNGTLPWVSNLGTNHYFGTICGFLDPVTNLPLPEKEIMFMVKCNAPGITLKTCPSFAGMEGTGTYGISIKDLLITEKDIIANPVRPYIKQIKSAFVLLQTGMGLGVIQGAIDSMWEVEDQLGHVNQYLEDRPNQLQNELDCLFETIMNLAKTPYDDSKEHFIKVLDARLHTSELSLRAAQSALLHQGARGYLMSSSVQRRIRESHFVAIVTPAIKHLRWELASQKSEVRPS